MNTTYYLCVHEIHKLIVFAVPIGGRFANNCMQFQKVKMEKYSSLINTKRGFTTNVFVLKSFKKLQILIIPLHHDFRV